MTTIERKKINLEKKIQQFSSHIMRKFLTWTLSCKKNENQKFKKKIHWEMSKRYKKILKSGAIKGLKYKD